MSRYLNFISGFAERIPRSNIARIVKRQQNEAWSHMHVDQACQIFCCSAYSFFDKPSSSVIARIARREGDPHERRERARRIRSDILLARRIRGGPAPALPQAWGGSVD